MHRHQEPAHDDGGRHALEPIGKLLVRLRKGKGWSQLRVAEALCRASCMPTISRHEVSRWEREERIPGSFWLEWLAVVLHARVDELEAAVALSRVAKFRGPPSEPAHQRLWRVPTADELVQALARSPTQDLRGVAHAWLAGPPAAPNVDGLPAEPLPVLGNGTGREVLAVLEHELVELRRMDDVMGGVDLVSHTDRKLRTAIEALRTVGRGTLQRPTLRLVAHHAQLAGWVNADAGKWLTARRSYQAALHAATVAGDRELGAYVLGNFAYHRLTGSAREALLLAQTGHAGVRVSGAPLVRALLLHRIALSAAQAGERQTAELALADAERTADRANPEPAWLYWLDRDELESMTGRCLAVLGKPLRAVRLLERRKGTSGPRSSLLYQVWLARSYLALGEVEQACLVAEAALMGAVELGSARVYLALRQLHPELVRRQDVAAAREYEEKAEAAFRRMQDVRPKVRGRLVVAQSRAPELQSH